MADTYSKLLRAIETNPIGAETVNAGVNIPADYSPRVAEDPSVLQQLGTALGRGRDVIRQMATLDPDRDTAAPLPISFPKDNPRDWRWDPKAGIAGLITSLPEAIVGTPERIHAAWQAGTSPTATQPEQTQAATNLALEALGLSSMGAKPRGALGTFIGRESPSFRPQAATRFEELEAMKRFTPAELWQRTGTGRTSEGLLQEISDHAMTINPRLVSGERFVGLARPTDTMRLANAVRHPEFAQAVPNSADWFYTNLPKSEQRAGVVGDVTSGVNRLRIGRQSLENAKETAAHELQHIADGVGGRSSGANSEQFLPKDFYTRQDALDTLSAKTFPQIRAEVARMPQFANADADTVLAAAVDLAHDPRGAIAQKLWRQNPGVMRDFTNVLKESNQLAAVQEAAFNKYEANIGEQRARTTSDRLYMTPAERRRNFPSEMERW